MDLEDIKDLRFRLLEAYERSTGFKILITDITKYAKNEYILDLKDDMREQLDLSDDDEVFSLGTQKKIFFSLTDQNFAPATIKKIKDYIHAASLKPPTNSKSLEGKLKQSSIAGAHVIDNDFKAEISKNVKAIKEIDFYTCKSNSGIQWKGIVDELYIDRAVLADLKNAVLLTSQIKNSKICAVLLGPSGSGKSTVLRQLAIQCIAFDLKVLWVYNIRDFNEHFNRFFNPNGNYLIIIDDWNTVEKNAGAKADFYSLVAKVNNVRIIIGDYHAERDYTEYLYGSNIFSLSWSENKDLATKIIAKVPEWENVNLNQLNNDLFNAPLFIVLFVIAQTNQSTDGKNVSDTNDFVSQFKKIVKNDMESIYRFDKSLALTIYYWACIYKEYGTAFSYEALLKIADFYNNNDIVSRQLVPFNQRNPICKILSHYVSLEKMEHPNYENIHIIKFNHDLLADALSSPLTTTWYFDTNVKLEIVEVLVQKEELSIASDLYWRPTKEEIDKANNNEFGIVVMMHGKPRYNEPFFKSSAQKTFLESTLGSNHEHSFSLDIRADAELKAVYAKIGSIKNEWEISEIVTAILFNFNRYRFSATYYKIFSTMIKLGCKSELVKYAKRMSLHDFSIIELVDEVLWGKQRQPDSPFFDPATFQS